MARWFQRVLAAAVTIHVMLAAAHAATAPEFPSSPENWLNFGPLTVESLKGKAAVLWFFEEGCPRCRERWPGLLATAQKYEGKPIVFIGINSGSSRPDIQAYAQQLRINWPIILDPTRQFEKACEVGEISLQNIYQCRILTADGQLQMGDFSDLDKSVERALQGAAWKVDPATVPGPLKREWLAIELGDYATAGKTLKKNLTSPKSDIRTAAEALNKAAQTEITSAAALARTSMEAGEKWKAYREYQQLGQRFAGFELPSEVGTNMRVLAGDPKVQAGLAATKNLDSAKKMLTASTASTRKRGLAMLEKIAQDVPDSDLATEAKSLYEQYSK